MPDVNQSTKTTELTITRTFDAPPEKVWQAWTDPEQFKRWWGPKDFTAPFAEMDVRVGGKTFSSMRAPDGQEFWGTGVYREVVPMQRLVMTDSFADEQGNVVSASYYGMSEDFPLEMLITVTFEGVDGKTRLTLQHAGLPQGEDRQQAEAGWNESLDKLADIIV